MRNRAPYGTWKSKLTGDVLASGSKRLGFPAILEDGSFVWIEGRPSEQGRQVVVRKRPGEAPVDLFPAPWNARSRVHEYGGNPFLFVGEVLYFVHDKDQRLYKLAPGGEPVLLGEDKGIRLAEMLHDQRRNRLIAVGEHHPSATSFGEKKVENGIVTVDLGSGKIEWLVRGRDFFAAPALSPDGNELAYLSWNLPEMPWDGAELFRTRLSESGAAVEPRHVAGSPSGSAFQPTYSPEGVLVFALEFRDESWNLHRLIDGQVDPIVVSPAEWGAPLWNLGTKLFDFSSQKEVVGAVIERGMMRIALANLETNSLETLWDDTTHIGQLAVRGDDVLFTLGWAGSGISLGHLDLRPLRSGKRDLKPTFLIDGFESLTAGDAPILHAADLRVSEAVSFPTSGGEIAHGFFHPPSSSEFEGEPGTLPPLMVLAHGGPTGCTVPFAQPSALYWVSRGFAVLDVNYRGSSGFGRPYRERLRGAWGEVDVDDCVFGARFLAEQGKVDGKSLFIRGGSAGGFTVLMALCKYPEVFTAAACLYGISDPRSLAQETHKFESQYDRYLFGNAEARERAFAERAPLLLAGNIKTPVIFFQGLEDQAVPPAQTESLYKVLHDRGVATEYHGYAGEQHGFRKAETVRDVYERELEFYARVIADRQNETAKASPEGHLRGLE